MMFEIVIPRLDDAAVKSRLKLLEAQIDREEAEIDESANRYYVVNAMIQRLSRDVIRAIHSTCGHNVLITLNRQLTAMIDNLNDQIEHKTAAQAKLTKKLAAKADFLDWLKNAQEKYRINGEAALCILKHSARASRTVKLLAEAANLELQQRAETCSSVFTRFDHFRELASDLVLAVSDIDEFKRAEMKFRELLDSVLDSQEGDKGEHDRLGGTWRIFTLRYVNIELPEWDVDEEVEEDAGGE